jgi:hypothetical protein
MIRIEVDMFSFFFLFVKNVVIEMNNGNVELLFREAFVETLKFPYHLIGPGETVEQKHFDKRQRQSCPAQEEEESAFGKLFSESDLYLLIS